MKRGDRFVHTRQITKDRQPMICTVTRVTKTTVYFQNTTGFKSKLSIEKFPEAVREWVR